ncbi:M81 family metallopeptidase [Paracoccus sp. Z330]|uniref:M81 family metallopeptidase n=1 Tax=Paracoccus onchidii TaxID=3017813 RepID=A0ABT4ZG02_9RHOB|nr:M81 family metallopeptidase [Paracoccus onchidii]MDB6178263.1 M81 family metallopeptidase [Paracoccus onchidii]
MKRIAIGGLHTECSSYSPLEQVAADFTRTEGQALIDSVPFDFGACDMQPLPLFHDRAVPGGPVAVATFAAMRNEFMERLRAALPLDGVLLLMHGAMFVPGIEDPEGDFIAEIRRIVGPQAIISAAFDLHGQITQQICDKLDAFAAYRTAPHIDTAQTWGRAAKLLSDALNGGPRPTICRQAVPILVPGEMSSTFVSPCNRLYAALPLFDQRPGICDANLMIGYVWADTARATAAAVVTATDPVAGQQAAREIAASYRDARDELVFDSLAAPLEDALRHVVDSPAILADSGDNPTAGGVGDRADVLAAVMDQQGLGTVLVAGIADPAVFRQLADGATEVTLGGGMGGGGPQVTLTVHDCRIINECAIMVCQDITVIVTAIRRPFHDIADFDNLGLPLDSYRLLVVKSGYLSPDLRAIDRQQVMALTDGAVCQHLTRLENLHRPAGTWPFDELG